MTAPRLVRARGALAHRPVRRARTGVAGHAARSGSVAGIVGGEEVVGPLPDVPRHVVETEAVGRVGPDRRRAVVAVEAEVLPREPALPRVGQRPARGRLLLAPRVRPRRRGRRAPRTPTRPRWAGPCRPTPRRRRRRRRRRGSRGGARARRACSPGRTGGASRSPAPSATSGARRRAAPARVEPGTRAIRARAAPGRRRGTRADRVPSRPWSRGRSPSRTGRNSATVTGWSSIQNPSTATRCTGRSSG